MPTFQEFLRTKAEEERQPERRQRRDEWIGAVGRLLDQIRAWLAESDPDNLLDIVPYQVRCSEPTLGYYDAPALRIGVGEDTIEVRPAGRDALGFVNRVNGGEKQAQGRVDITHGVTQRKVLYRVVEGNKDVWYLIDDQYKPVLLDRTRLEAVLQDYLS